MEDTVLEAAARLVDPAWYLQRYPDVAASRTHPVAHYMNQGWKEERQPNQFFYPTWYRETYLRSNSAQSNPLVDFSVRWPQGNRPNPVFDPAYISKALGQDVNPLLLELQRPGQLDQLSTWFSRSAYRTLYPDLRHLPCPELHFLHHGIGERRRPAPALRVVPHSLSGSRFCEVLDSFMVDGTVFTVERTSIPASMMAQIMEQSRHEVAVLAPGRKALGNLPVRSAPDVTRRCGIDAAALLAAAGERCDAVVFIRALIIGGGEKYTAELVRCLRQAGERVLVIVSGQSSAERKAMPAHGSLDALSADRMLMWKDLQTGGARSPRTAALLMNKLRPRRILVVNSGLGLDMLRDYGRPISSFARAYVTYFSELPDALDSPYTARYFRKMAHHVTTLTDNGPLAATLRNRVTSDLADKVVVLPPCVDAGSEDAFTESLRRRLDRWPARSGLRLAWIARIESYKGTAILRELALLVPHVTIDLYGPLQNAECAQQLALPNLRHRGFYRNLSELDLSPYDGFLQTSLIEGFPNIVLEMAVAGLPMICSDVGGLRETFGDDAVLFVELQSDHGAVARDFARRVQQLEALHADALRGMVLAARDAALARHARPVYEARARAVLGLEGGGDANGL